MKKEIKEKLEKIERWWKGKGTEPLISCSILRSKNFIDLNRIWENEKTLPDFDKLVDGQIDNLKNYEFLGIAYPSLPHLWGGRGTPMPIAGYIGGRVIFREDTVWVDRTIEDWEKVKIEVREDNFWLNMSKKLIEKQVERFNGEFLLENSHLGDALTCFSLMRGIEDLLIEIVEIPEIIIEKIDEFVSAWIKAHNLLYSIFKEKIPGDATWLIWAPGKTDACQCDFSTMISPKYFEKFVVYELDKMKNYLEYMVWHLDGPEEIKHLDILLSLPYIKAIQIVPGAGKPPCSSSLWLPVIERILKSGRGVILPMSEDDIDLFMNNFYSGRVIYWVSPLDIEKEEDRIFLKKIEKYFSL